MKISILIDTKSKASLIECAEYMNDLIKELETTAPSAVHPAPSANEDANPQIWIVDGRNYTAEQIREGGFTIEQLDRSGWFDADIAKVLGVDLGLVHATILNAESEVVEPPFASTATQPPATTVALDSKDMPWDARIHAGTKTKLNDGTWKIKRSVDKAVVEQVEAELINLMSIEPKAADNAPAIEQPTDPVVIPPPAATTTAPVVIPPPAAEPEDAMTFAEFLKACSAKMTAGETSMDRILAVVTGKGVPSLQLVNSKPELIPELWAEISLHQKVA